LPQKMLLSGCLMSLSSKCSLSRIRHMSSPGWLDCGVCCAFFAAQGSGITSDFRSLKGKRIGYVGEFGKIQIDELTKYYGQSISIPSLFMYSYWAVSFLLV
jgi:hypothetical protein